MIDTIVESVINQAYDPRHPNLHKYFLDHFIIWDKDGKFTNKEYNKYEISYCDKLPKDCKLILYKLDDDNIKILEEIDKSGIPYAIEITDSAILSNLSFINNTHNITLYKDKNNNIRTILNRDVFEG